MRFLIVPIDSYPRSYYGRRYGFTNFVGDAVMTCLTGGIWLIWIVIREVKGP